MARKQPRGGLFGRVTPQSIGNALRNPGLAAGNVVNRFSELGGGTTSALNRIRYAITPQTAAAQMRQEGEQYLNQQFPEGYEFSLEGRPQSLVSGVSQQQVQQAPEQSPAGESPISPNYFSPGTGGETNYVLMNGQVYDLNNATDRQRYLTDRMGLLVAERDNYLADLQTRLGRELSDAERSRDINLASLDQDIADTETEARNYVKEYGRTVKEFGEGKALGDVNRQFRFAQLSPNAFQSSEATSANYANDQYLRGLSDLAAGAEETVGGQYLANPEDIAQLGASSVLGRQRANLFADRNRIGEEFNRYLTDQQRALEQGTTQANEYVTSQADNLTGQLVGIGGIGQLPRYQAARNAFAPAQTNMANLSAYTPFTNFSAVPAGVQPGAGFTPRRTSGFSENTGIDTYLGSTQLNTKDKDILRKYLLGQN